MVDYFTCYLRTKMQSIALDNWWDSLKYINLLCQKEKKSVSPKCCLHRFSSVFFLSEGMTLTASVVVKLLLHLTASNPHRRESTLSADMSYSSVRRCGQNEFINERFSPHIPSPSLCLYFPSDSSSWELSKAIVSILIGRERYSDCCSNYLFQWNRLKWL